MGKIFGFFKLRQSDKTIVIKALTLLWITRIMLWILPFSSAKQIVNKFAVFDENKFQRTPRWKLIWAVEVMSPYTLRATCLSRALATHILLARYNYSSSIKIGVSKDKGEFESHAWLVSGDEIILGESETEYTPILDIGEKLIKSRK